MQTLGHGGEGEAVRCGSIEERTFPGVIASQEEMLFLLVPHSEAEGAGKMVDALLAPTLPRGQQHVAVGHGSGLLAGESPIPARASSSRLSRRTSATSEVTPAGRERLSIEAIFREEAKKAAAHGKRRAGVLRAVIRP
jgi:hypothetical protein